MATDEMSSDTELSILNPHPKFLEGPSLLHHLIADEDTDATALECHDSDGLALQLSYTQLHARTKHLARILASCRSATNSASITPLLIPQSAALYISQIAILKSGSAFCPLNLDVPEERLKFILDDVAATIVITTPEFRSKFDCIPDLPLLVLDHQGNIVESGSNGSAKEPLPASTGETHDLVESFPSVTTSDPAYIMYTSGSTGTPKAVCLSHRAVTQSLLAHDRFIPQFSRFLQFANPTFDVSVFEIYFPLFRGKTLISCDRTYLLSDLPNVITKLNVDGAELTPSVVASLVRSRKSVPKLRTLLTIGEMLNPQTVREFAGTTEDDSLLWGMYGPTEAAIHCTLQPSFKQSDTVNTIGIPLDTVSCFIIKPTEEVSAPDDVQILPQGEVGELAVGGHQLADGYLNREEQTRAVFIQHPVYGSLYRTGDKAKLTQAGLLECLGRISKGQVKLRGQRIELGEIEHAASKLEGVHAASASVIDGQLVLFCVADLSQIKVADVDTSCRKWLPRYMVPNDIVIMKDFPYLPSGKTDSKKLDADYKESMSQASEECRESPPDNQKLVGLLRQTISKSIKPTSNLASAGLDSLKALRLATELRKHGYPQLSAVDLLLCTNVKDLESLISKHTTKSPRTQDADFVDWNVIKAELEEAANAVLGSDKLQAEVETVFPCTPLQDAMLVETAKQPKAYCNSATITLPVDTTFDNLTQAFTLVAKQHQALRSGFLQSTHDCSAYIQVVWSDVRPEQFRQADGEDADSSLTSSTDLQRPLQIRFSRREHKMVILLHHALYDQWSLDILIDDLYRALRGESLPERASFALVSQDSLEDRCSKTKQNSLISFWKSYMAGASLTKLPNLTGKVSKGRKIKTLKQTSRVGTPQMERVARRYKVSESVVFQTAYGYLLSLYAGQSDITFGTVFSGRTAAIEGIQDLFGPMLATLPTRLSSTDARRFKDLARAVQTSNRSIMANTELPLLGIKKAASIDSSASLFDSIFVWQGSPREAIDQTDVRLVDTTDYVEFDLILDIEPTIHSFEVKATYREDILPQAQTKLFLDQLDLILHQVTDFPECRLDELFVDVRPQQCLSIHNPDPSMFDCSGGLTRLVEESIKLNADTPALCFAKDIGKGNDQLETLTYKDLSRRANQLAHFMLAEELQPGGLVCVIMEKSANLYISLLAIIKAGCGYLPIVPSTPRQRVEQIFTDAPIDFVLCDRTSVDVVRPLKADNVFTIEDAPLSEHSTYRPRTTANPRDIAYAVYTSGTTGTPKGVLVTHENICSNLKTLADLYPVPDGSRLLQACNQAFDVSVFEIFFAWSRGMCLCSASNDVLFRDLDHSVRELGITHLSLTPTVAALIRPNNVPDVKFLVTAGEPITASIHHQWAGRGLYQGYGPSETTNICSVNVNMSADDAINNIGQSFVNTSTFILPTNGDFAPLPRGALGELCFGGQQVFMGYQNMPDLTASKIINHPRYGRIYRSGDLGRLSHDGTILIEGRTDTQRKIRGQRIELGEIISNLLQCQDVRDATALVGGTPGAEVLVAFWIPERSDKNRYTILDIDSEIVKTISTIKRQLGDRVPSYMIPSAFVPISAFPMTSQSKVDNTCLLEDFADLPDDYLEDLNDEDGEDDGEWSETDHEVRRVLAEVLNAHESSIRRNTALFGLGLDSISAIRLSSQLRLKFGVQIDVSDVLKNPRLALLSDLLDSQSKDQFNANGHVSLVESFLLPEQIQAVKRYCSEKDVSIDRVLPCTPLQEAMISASLSQGSGAYLNRNVLKVTAPVDRLQKSWNTMIDRHEILRTIFLSTENTQYPFVQAVLENVDLPWEESTGTASAANLLNDFESDVPKVVDSLQIPFKLTLYKGATDTYLVVDMHHVLYDANAMNTLLVEVERLLNGEDLPPPVLFDDFLEHMLHIDKDTADGFFDGMLTNFKPRNFAGVGTTKRIYRCRESNVDIPPGAMQHFQKKHSVSLLALTQAAWSQVLSVLQNCQDLCFGNVVSGRTVPVDGVDRLVAPCFNTLPVRTKLSEHKDNLALVQHLHQLNIDTLSYQLTPLRRIQQRLGAGSLFDSLLLLQQSNQELDPSIWSLTGEKGDMDFPCILEVVPNADQLRLSLHYQQSLLANGTTAIYPLSDFACDTSIDRRALDGILGAPALERKSSKASNNSSESSEDEWTATEELIRDTFLGLSNVDTKNVTKHTTIYRLGLDSISAIQAANKLKSNGYSVTAADVLEHATPAELAAFLDAHSETVKTDHPAIDLSAFDRKHRSQLDISENVVESVRPCTAVQAGMLTAFMRSKGRDYLNHFAYDASFVTDVGTLEKALEDVSSTTEMLRTGFVEIEDSEASFAMVTYKAGTSTPPIEVVREDSFDTLAQAHQKDVLSSVERPPWRCKIVERDGKITMLLSMHHALYDAASLSQILDQVRDTIGGKSPAPISSVKMALGHILANSTYTKDREEFWTSQLEAATPIRFPNLHPVIPQSAGVLDVSQVCARSRSDLETTCSSKGLSLQAIFQAAWAKLLSSYTGEEQVTFGIVHSGRVSQDTQDACFPTINTLPLTCNVAADNASVLQSLMAFNVGAQKHCYTPLSSIQRWLGLQNEALFDTIFAFQKPLSEQDPSKQWYLLYEKAAVDYAVSIEIEHLPNDVLRLRTTFDSEILPKEQAYTMLRQLEALALEILGTDTTMETTNVSVVPAKDPIIKSDITLLHQMVDRTVQSHPDRIALEFVHSIDEDGVNSQRWTYKELDERANQVARLLHDRGVKPGQVVGLCFDKCPEGSFAFLGIVKAGCCILAIDATAPMARKEFIVSDSSAAAVLCSSAVAAEMRSIKGTKIFDLSNDLRNEISFEPLALEHDAITPESLSYILYTSGTTGTPKGCEITQDNVVQALLAFQRLFAGRWTESSVWLQFASYHFDVAILEHFWTWSVGMKMLSAPRDLILEDIASFIDRFQVSHLDLTPSLGRLLDPASVPSLHSGVFITGGEAVKPEMLRTWGDIGCLFNFYGPTECTIGVTTFPSVPTNGKASNIGWAFDNVGTCVLKPGTLSPVLRGGVGELCIFGKLVGKGYLNRPDLNNDRFPYASQLGERVYRTGDLVRVLHDNSFEFLGRADSQVKLRGQRLEIDEIIAVMLECDSIKDAVCVVARQEDKQKDQLVAFITPSSDRKQGQPTLYEGEEIETMIKSAKNTCEDKLPVYMVPTHFIPIHFVPLSVNNKQDDKLLKQFYQGLNTAQLQELSLPGSEQRELNQVEQGVVDALSATLGADLEDVKPDANLFALGLSSISAVQLARRLKSAGHQRAGIAIVMQNATVAKLARALDDTSSSSSDSEALAAKQAIAACQQKYLGQAASALGIELNSIEKLAPCTPLQQGILYKSQSSDSGLYFNRFLFGLNCADVKKLRQVLQHLVTTTDILRSAFVETEDGHVQVVKKEAALDWHELSGSAENDLLDGLHQDWIAANDRGLFYPFSVAVVEQRMQVSIHHALYDGNSWGLLLQRIQQIYTDVSLTQSPSFFDVLAHGPLRASKDAKHFWQAHLQAAVFEDMQQLVGEPKKQDAIVTRPIECGSQLDHTRKALQVTPQAIIQTAWLVTLSQYHAGPVGLIVSGRSLDVDAGNVIGPLFNTIPFAWTIDVKESWAAFCKRCHDFNVSTLPHHHTPLRDISKWLGKSSMEPLFETLFVFQQPQDNGSGLDKIMDPIDDDKYVADYPLSFEAEQRSNGQLSITIGAQGHYCDDKILDKMISEFETNLAVLLSKPDSIIPTSNAYKEKARSGPIQRDLPDANGYHGSFEWTTEAEAIRKEMAFLANLEEPDIDEHSALFAIGLDSIDAVKLSARLKKNRIVVPVSALMKSQTIPKILSNIKVVETKDDSAAIQKTRKLRQAALEKAVRQTIRNASDVEQILAATPMQEALVSEMIKSEYEAYFNHDVLEIRTDVDVEKLESAWAKVVEVNPILRTAFIPVEDTAVDSTFAQVVMPYQRFRFDQKTISVNDRIDALLPGIAEEVRKADALSAPFWLTLVGQGSKTLLILSIAHALYDGFSLSLLHSDVAAAYESAAPSRLSYAAVIDNVLDATGPQATNFWESLLSNVKPSRITSSSSANETYRAELVSSLSATAITSFAKSQNITPQALVQTAWTLYLSTLTKSLDVVYGLVLAGRDTPEAEEVLFPTMNTVAARQVIHGTGKQMLQEMQEQLLKVREFQATPLRKITQIAKKAQGFEGGLFDALFTYQKAPQTQEGRKLYESVLGASDVEYPVAVEAEILGEELVWRNAVKSGVRDQEGTEKMLVGVDHVLKELVENAKSEVLIFDGEAVSVAGQDAFRVVEESENTEQAKQEPEHVELSWTETEAKIRTVVAQVAKVSSEDVGKTTRLENLGIDSISAIKLSSLLKKQGLNLAVSKIIKAGTIAAMANFIERKTEKDSTVSKAPRTNTGVELVKKHGVTASSLGLSEDQVEAILPITAGQAFMLVTWTNSKGKLFYPTFTYKLQGQVEDSTIEQAWQALVNRYAVLRTSFAVTGKKELPYVQTIFKAREASLQGQIQGQPFANLAVSRKDNVTQLKLSIHHALYDAVSLQMLVSELEGMLNGSVPEESPSGITSLISTTSDLAAKDKQRKFWISYLADVAPCPPSTGPHSGGKTQVFTPSALELTSKHQSWLRSSGLSVQALFFAAYAQVYASQNNLKGDVIIGVYLANRTDEMERLAAPTVNLLPLRVHSPSTNSTEDVARQIQEDLKKISEEGINQTSLWEIERWTGVKVDAFVNFVKLPEEDEKEKKQGEVRIINVDEDEEHEFRGRAEVIPVEEDDWTLPEELQGAGVEDSYLPSIDIEATVRNGKLAVGVFGFESVVKLGEAKKIVDGIKQSLNGFFI
ncbi:AMP-binding enzyme-like protein 8 [Elsinoe fawcettii]|nr:AMP-binding enzyme-like protein 8 [Elsinoe fawcettii]